MRHLRFKFWLLACDAIEMLGGFGTAPHTWCLQRASDACDWGEGAKCGEDEPF